MGMLIDSKIEENCQEAYATWQARDEKAELDWEVGNLRSSVAEYNKILKDMGEATPDEKEKLMKKLEQASETIKLEEKAVEQKQKEFDERKDKAREKFHNMSPNEKALAARAMLTAGVANGMPEAKELLESLEKIAERNPETMKQVQETAELALGKTVGEMDTRHDLSQEEKKELSADRKHRLRRIRQKEKEKEREREGMERTMERRYPV